MLGFPILLVLRIEAIGFPTFGLLLYRGLNYCLYYLGVLISHYDLDHEAET